MEIIKKLHQEIDEAQDRLLRQAEEIIKNTIISETEYEKQVLLKAARLKKIGFVSSKIVEESEVIIKNNDEKKEIIFKNKEQADLIQYYKREYPFQKFLTEEELDIICDKYGLIHAPISSYLKDIPEKNLCDIENVKDLKPSLIPKNHIKVIITEFWSGVPKWLRKKLSGELDYDGPVYKNGIPSDDDLLDYLKKTIDFRGYSDFLYKEAEVIKYNTKGLFICAPKSHFKLDDLKKYKNGLLEYTKTEIRDPIVYRYCKGGVQIITKWGPESEDENLINEVNN